MPGLLRSRPGMSPFCSHNTSSHDGFFQNPCVLEDHQCFVLDSSSAHSTCEDAACLDHLPFPDHQEKYLPSFYERMLHRARFTSASRFLELTIAPYRYYQRYGQRAHPTQKSVLVALQQWVISYLFLQVSRLQYRRLFYPQWAVIDNWSNSLHRKIALGAFVVQPKTL